VSPTAVYVYETGATANKKFDVLQRNKPQTSSLQPGIVQTENILGHNSVVERQKNYQNSKRILSRKTLVSFGKTRIQTG
jgi:hypothetical protein